MIERVNGNLKLRGGTAPDASLSLERDGYTLLGAVFDAPAIEALRTDIDAAFAKPAIRGGQREGLEFRHEMLNHSEACQRAVAHPMILEAIEPLLGEDCHVIANTAWRNPPSFHGGPWHCDAGPHVPRSEHVPWDDRISYPVFAIGAHIFLQACPRSCGPTAIVPGSHRSGRLPPEHRLLDEALSYDGRSPAALESNAGDVALFVSDVWHRGLPAEPDATGRFFLQVHYARRDIAQRLRPTDEFNQLSPAAIARAASPRERTLIGLHAPLFYDG